MRMVLALVIAVALAGCGISDSASKTDSFVKDVRKTVPSLSDLSDADLISWAKDLCAHPFVLNYTGFEGRHPTTDAEANGMDAAARRHCDELLGR